MEKIRKVNSVEKIRKESSIDKIDPKLYRYNLNYLLKLSENNKKLNINIFHLKLINNDKLLNIKIKKSQ